MIIFRSCFNIFRVLVAEYGAESIRTILEKEIDWEGDECDDDAEDPLDGGQAVDVHGDEAAEQLAAQDLHDQDNDPDDDEGGVAENAFKYVDLIIDLSRANHVENLHEDEEVEDDGQVARRSRLLESLVDRPLLHVLLHSHQNVEVAFFPLVL